MPPTTTLPANTSGITPTTTPATPLVPATPTPTVPSSQTTTSAGGAIAAVLTPQQELDKINSDPTYAGGQYYGRTPNGIADLVNGGVVNPTTPSPYQAPGSPPLPSGPAATIAGSGVSRYTAPSTTTPDPSTTPATPQQLAGGTYVGEDNNLYYNYDSTPVNTTLYPDVNAIRQSVLTDAESQVAAIQNEYAPLIKAAQDQGTINSGKQRAEDARSGNLGDDFGDSADNVVVNNTDAAVGKVNDQMNAAINAVMTKVAAAQDTAVKTAQTTASTDSTAYQKVLADNVTAAKADITSLAKGGIPLESLDPSEKQALMQASGFTDESIFDGFYNSQLPPAQATKYTYEKLSDGSFLPISVDPTTGQPTAGTPIVPPDDGNTYDSFSVLPDGTPVFVNKTTGQATVAGTNGTTLAGTDKTNFAKPAAGTSGNPTAAEAAATKLGTAWLKQQATFTANDLTEYQNDPVFAAWVNNQAKSATSAQSTAGSGGTY